MILSDTMNILIAGGGTSDVLLPGLAVADELRDLIPAARIIFVGAGAVAEERQIRDRGYDYLVAGTQQDRHWSRHLLHRLVGPHVERQVLRQTRPALVLSMGGEIGEAVGRAAARMGVPLVVFEPHVLLTPATRRLAPWADLVCLGFDETRAWVTAHCPVRVTGIPIQRNQRVIDSEDSGQSQDLEDRSLHRLLILGDHEHSRQLNAILPRALWELDRHLTGWRVIHRARSEEVRGIRRLYSKFGIDAVATVHIHKLADLLARADLVIAATSMVDFVSLAAAARPTVVAVDKTAATDWLIQTAHALSHHGACTVVEEAASRDAWTRALRPLLASAPSRRRMQISLGNHFRRDGAWHLASMVRDTLGSAGRTRSA